MNVLIKRAPRDSLVLTTWTNISAFTVIQERTRAIPITAVTVIRTLASQTTTLIILCLLFNDLKQHILGSFFSSHLFIPLLFVYTILFICMPLFSLYHLFIFTTSIPLTYVSLNFILSILYIEFTSIKSTNLKKWKAHNSYILFVCIIQHLTVVCTNKKTSYSVFKFYCILSFRNE